MSTPTYNVSKSTELTLNVIENRPEVLKKMEAWAKMGQVIHDSNLAFQARAQKITAQLIMKPGKLLVIDSENAIAAAKKELALQTADRIAITSKFDAVHAVLSKPEKDAQVLIAQASSDLLALKKEIADEAAKETAKKDELRRIREAIANRIAEVDARYKSMIAIRVTDAYTRGLEGECPTEDTTAFLAQEREWATEEMFTIKKPQPKPTFATQEEVDSIWVELSQNVQPPSYYVSLFHTDLENKFEFYSINLKQKEASVARAKQEQGEKLADIGKEKEAEVAGNKLEAIATTHEVQTVTVAKALKKSWKVQMENDLPSALAIISAFVGNIKLCEGGIRASWMNVTVEQMANALAWAKNKDDKFNVTGINFVSVEKL